MRPIDKGDGKAYTDRIPANFDFSRYSIDKKNIANKWLNLNPGVYTATLENCLAFWLHVVKLDIAAIPAGSRTPDQREQMTLKGMIADKVTDVYKLAGIPMVSAIGDYCCYCDTKIPGLLEVEHRVPKSNYPTYAVSWENFLMSCGPCNNTKRDNPDRATVLGWMNGDPPNPTEEDFYDEISHHYLWADIDADPYQYVVPRLGYKDQTGTWKVVPIDVAYNLSNEMTSYDLLTRTIKANLYDGEGDLFGNNVEVTVHDRKASTGTRPEIIDLCGLNAPGNADSTYDRRLFNRTKAWFTILSTLGPISLLDPDDPNQEPVFNLLWRSVLQHASSLGFYSVWFKILRELDTELAKKFMLDGNTANYFPGTNTTLANKI